MGDTIKLDTRKLNSLIKALGKKNLPKARVGILESKNSRQGTVNLKNSQIGAKHEFGIGIVQRSFLRIPIAGNLQKYLNNSQAFKKDVLQKVLSEKKLDGWMDKVAVIAETIVQDAFNTGGFGKWKPSNMDHKKVHQTLVETQQLRNSIGSEVISA